MNDYNDARNRQPLRDAVAAVREEAELEHLVEVVGTERAQRAAHEGRLPELVSELAHA